MKIELYIDGEKKLFTAPIVPLLAKRKYLEVQSKSEQKAKEDENYPTAQDQLDEEDEMVGILANVVFGGQFTVQQVYEGAEDPYVYSKLHEAVFGKKTKKENDEGNNQGE